MTFLDAGILVGPVLSAHPEHANCLSAQEDSRRPFTNAHAWAETFTTLTRFYKVPPETAAELTLSLSDSVQVEALALADYHTAIGVAHTRGVWAVEFIKIPCTRLLPDEGRQFRS